MITARVIRIISPKQLIFNAGSSDGVKRGMKFRVYSVSEDVVDPETGESLGTFRSWKTTIEPDRIEERFTIASQPYRDSDDEFDDGRYWPNLPIRDGDVEPFSGGDHVVIGDVVEEEPDLDFPTAATDDDIPF